MLRRASTILTGLPHSHETGGCRFDSDPYRLRAEGLHRSGLAADAAAAMEHALAIAERQGARLAALHAALDNLRLHADGPAAKAAAERLASVAGSFDPGEPLPDSSRRARPRERRRRGPVGGNCRQRREPGPPGAASTHLGALAVDWYGARFT